MQLTASKKEVALGYLFLSPWVIGFVLFGLYPFVMSFYYSLCQYDVLRIPMYVGFENYRMILFKDPYFWKSIWNTLYYTGFRTPLSIVGSLLLAVFMNRSMRGIRLFRTIYFIPSIITGVVMSVIWMWLFNPQIGLVNIVLAFFGVKGPLWLQSAEWSKPAMILMSLWSIGGGRMLVFLAALQGVPQHLYEAVELDGGSEKDKFFHITLPIISPIIFLWTVIEVIFSMQIFTESYVMTKGGPLNSTLFYNLYLYNRAFEDYNMGYASALAWILLIITLLLTLIQFRMSRKMVYYEGLQV